MPGSVIELPEDRATAHVSATAQSWEPFDSLELVVDGAVREAVSASGTPAQASLDLELAIHKPAALAVRCRNNGRVVAHSSAIRVKKTGQSWPRDANALQYFRESLEKTLGWLAQKGRYRSDRDRAHLEETIRQAQTKLASRPE